MDIWKEIITKYAPRIVRFQWMKLHGMINFSNYYGVWEALFNDHNEDDYWIGHKECDTWFHRDCGGVTPDNELE